ncbi:ATP-binding protein [Guyparkeria sp. SB14A]|uniref:ATP-binding protein n=1 Tax=Guyparkeria sp. SB14A TaxID=2571147 RepID=UPI00145D9AE4|nr:ATP-binding protein [Guyparkeria sp. SB14A]
MRKKDDPRTPEEKRKAKKTMDFVLEKLGGAPWEEKPLVCKRHGMYDALETADGWTSCPECAREHEEQKAVEDMERNRALAKAERIQHFFGTRPLPLRFRNASLANYRPHNDTQKQALDLAQALADRVAVEPCGALNLILLGSVGMGKTHLGYALYRNARQARRSAYLDTVHGLMERFKASYSHRTTETPKELLEHLIEVDLLVLDEVGKSAQTDHEGVTLHGIIDRRWANSLPIVILSNTTFETLEDAVGGSPAVSRLLSNGDVLQVKGEDYRFLQG